MVLVGDEFAMEIGGPQVVEEHQWTMEELVQVLARAEVVRCGLPTGGWCAAGEEADDGEEMPFGFGKLDTGSSSSACGCGCSAAAREGEGIKALQRAVHDGEEVAAGDGSGTSWRAGKKPPGERKGVGIEGKRRVDDFCSWRWRSGRGIGGERRWQERRRREKRRGQRRKKQRAVRRTCSQFLKSSGTPL
jgi:hypothetical protein